jgi:hypothetical protein
MKTYTVQLTIEQWQIIGAALGEMPFKTSAPVLAELNKQLQEQNKPTAVETIEAAE